MSTRQVWIVVGVAVAVLALGYLASSNNFVAAVGVELPTLKRKP